jgi:hypothetical protein
MAHAIIDSMPYPAAADLGFVRQSWEPAHPEIMNIKVGTFIIIALALTASALSGAELTAVIKRDVRRGQNTALFAIKPGQTFPSTAMSVFMAEDKKHEKDSDAFRLGFAQSVCSHMTTAYEFALSLSREELQQAGVGWVLYSSRATTLQIQMHLTDAQMVELFSVAGFRKIKNRPGPL